MQQQQQQQPNDSYAAAAGGTDLQQQELLLQQEQLPLPPEFHKMSSGARYNPLDADLRALFVRCRTLLRVYNASIAPDTPSTLADRTQVLARLLGEHAAEAPPYIEPPFYCDYGRNIRLGKGVYFNFNCVVLDICPVTIGDRTLFGPNVQIYTACHPLDPVERATGVEFGKPVSIGRDVWVGGNVTICPGVAIGDAAVVGAGSVVTKNVEPYTVVAGNPARLIRRLERKAEEKEAS
ncbi:maltose O-acetyltransferase [Zopfochytrium polystomum]|nr:maltose O-acetyltransferase [Zopfochytrium polystomum]